VRREVALCVAAASLAGCRGDGAQQVAEAVETFVEFGMSNEERPKAPSKRARELPHANERSRALDTKGRGGAVLRVEVDLPHHLPSHEVEAVLGFEVDRILGERRYPRVEVRGLPAGLLRHGGVMGVATGEIGRDGGSATKVRSHIDDDAPPLEPEQYQALVALEFALAGGGRGAGVARRRVEDTHGADTVRAAIRAARRRFPRKGR